ncbi:fatty acid oxygenase [Apiospora aurea]|uniref:Fatty acid oxygenase n=1 Tax=Apiospora aurea TaxID=335848 RepID=A0ABR1QWQ5_9PEZI
MDRSGSCNMSGPTHTRKPRLRLLPLYGQSSTEEAAVRQFKNGLIKDDKFATSEACINEESDRFPAKLSQAEKDEAVYRLARRITCRLYINIILNDYFRTLLGVNRTNADCNLEPESLTRRALPPLSKPSKTSPKEGYEAAVSLVVGNWWKNALSEADNDYMATRYSRSTYQAKPPKADAVVNPTEEDMAHELRRSVQSIASAYSTNRVPIAFRNSQIKTVARAREKQLPTLNNFRQIIGLPAHDTFEHINTSPLVTAKLRALYAHPDDVELYPGMVAEQPPPSNVFATNVARKWSWIGSTVTHAVQSPIEYKDTNLGAATTFIPLSREWVYRRAVFCNRYHESSSDQNVEYGCVMHKLLLRAFSNHFSADSVFAHFPFVTPDGNRAILARLGSDAYYSFEAADGTTSAPTIFSLEAIAGSAQSYGMPLGLTGVLETSKTMLPNASRELRSVVSRTANSPRHKPIEIDLVDQVIAPYFSGLFCSHFSMKLSRTKFDGFLTTTEVWQAMKSIYEPACNLDPVYSLDLNIRAMDAMEQLRVQYIKSKKARTRKALRERLLWNWPDSQDVDHSVCPATKMACHQLVSIQQVLVESIEYFLTNGKMHLGEIQQLSLGMNDGHPNCARTTGFQVLHYLLEGYRLYLAADGRSFWRKLTTWSPTFINVSASARNNATYPNPGALVLSRSLESYENIGVGKTLLNLLATQPMLTLFLELATLSRWEVVDNHQGQPRRINIPTHHWGIVAVDYSADVSSEVDWDLLEDRDDLEDGNWISVSDDENKSGNEMVEIWESHPRGEVTLEPKQIVFLQSHKALFTIQSWDLSSHSSFDTSSEALDADCSTFHPLTSISWKEVAVSYLFHFTFHPANRTNLNHLSLLGAPFYINQLPSFLQQDTHFTIKTRECQIGPHPAYHGRRLLQQAEDRWELPPKDMNPSTLSGSANLPSLAEVKPANQLQSLVDKLEVAFCLDTCQSSETHTTAEEFKQCPELREHVRKAVFRVLIAGAALAGAYTEPFLEAEKAGKTHVNDDPELWKRFPIYDWGAKADSRGPAFKHISAWLVDDILSDVKAQHKLTVEINQHGSKDNLCISKRPCAYKSPGRDDCISRHLVYRNVLQMLWVYRHMWGAINPDAYPHDWGARFPRQEQGVHDDLSDGSCLTVPIVLFGSFRVQDVEVHLLSSQSHNTWDANHDLEKLLHEPAEYSSMLIIPMPGSRDLHHWSTPLDIAFLDYVLKQYAGARLARELKSIMVPPMLMSGYDSPDLAFYLSEFLRSFSGFMGADELPRRMDRETMMMTQCAFTVGWSLNEKELSSCDYIGASVHL